MKIKSLAAEAAIIRFEERRTKGDLRASLRNHRVEVVRQEQRSSLLAYGLLRGRSYAQLEKGAKTPADHSRIATLLHSFGPRADKQTAANIVQQWLRGDQCGLDRGVMTPGAEGSTPSPRANMAG